MKNDGEEIYQGDETAIVQCGILLDVLRWKVRWDFENSKMQKRFEYVT